MRVPEPVCPPVPSSAAVANVHMILDRTYPAVDATLLTVAKNRTGLEGSAPLVSFTFSKFKSQWLYIFTDENKNPTNVARIKAFSIILVSSVREPGMCVALVKERAIPAHTLLSLTQTFHPEKYGALCKLMSNQFNTTGSTVAVLDRYLAAMGGFIPEAEFNPASFDKAQVRHSTFSLLSFLVISVVDQCLTLHWFVASGFFCVGRYRRSSRHQYATLLTYSKTRLFIFGMHC
jgi:hypothetical protein